jgi:hypothetical protein
MDSARAWIVAAALVAASASNCVAATHSATPETLADVVRHAGAGDSIALAQGDYRGIRISRCHFDPTITLNAAKATFYGLLITDCAGIAIRGGEFRLPPPVVNSSGVVVQGWAIRSDRSANIAVQNARFVGPGHPDTGDGFVYGEGEGVRVSQDDGVVVEDSSFTGLETALVIDRTDNFRVSRITSTGMRSDGIDIAESHHGVIEYVQCSGTVIRDKEHPDCIQAWSKLTSVPTSDIVVRHVSVVGDTQGISFLNQAYIGNDTGGFDRITIEDNDVEVSYPIGIRLDDGRDSIVRRNHIRTRAGAKYWATLHTTAAKACGNVVEPGAGKPGYSDEKC